MDIALQNKILSIAIKDCSPQARSRFFSLPPELRNRIYVYCAVNYADGNRGPWLTEVRAIHDLRRRSRPGPVPDLLYTCKRFAKEATTLLYRTARGRCSIYWAVGPTPTYSHSDPYYYETEACWTSLAAVGTFDPSAVRYLILDLGDGAAATALRHLCAIRQHYWQLEAVRLTGADTSWHNERTWADLARIFLRVKTLRRVDAPRELRELPWFRNLRNKYLPQAGSDARAMATGGGRGGGGGTEGGLSVHSLLQHPPGESAAESGSAAG
ncbi:hypothetical protein F4780DRAFT_578302 [Xylariomycetidae sp. FL0641]|nr:hypothetical protein F4780DRAFT_578302 [Xylariomycetidae sp. FL0641]